MKTFSFRHFFLVKSGLFAVLLGRLQVAPGGIELSPRRSAEIRGSSELGGLRALLLDGRVLDTSGGYVA